MREIINREVEEGVDVERDREAVHERKEGMRGVKGWREGGVKRGEEV